MQSVVCLAAEVIKIVVKALVLGRLYLLKISTLKFKISFTNAALIVS